MRLGGEVNHVLHESSVPKVFAVCRRVRPLGWRKVFDGCLWYEETKPTRSESQTEIEVLAADPKIVAVKSGRFDGFPAREQADSLSPSEFRETVADFLAVCFRR